MFTRWKKYKSQLKSTNKVKYFIVETIETLGVAFFFAFLIKEFIIQVSVVPTGSMIPTMKGGQRMTNDRLLVNKYIYDFWLPKRGDIVVFESPFDDGKDYVKRCVGLPHETISMKDGYVYINGKELVLAGVDIQRDLFDMKEVLIPEGHYFMLGDNRANSQDSRFWGFVPRNDLIGKALFTFWPLDRMKVLR